MPRADSHTHLGYDPVRKKLGMPYRCDADMLARLAFENGVEDVITAGTPPGRIHCDRIADPNHPQAYGSADNIPNLKKVDAGGMYFECPQCGSGWKTADPYSEANEILFREAERINKAQSSVRFVPVPIMHPLKPSIEEDIKELYSKHEIKGLKFESIVDKTPPSRYPQGLLDAAKKYGLRFLIHCDATKNSRPEDIYDFARKNPAIKVQMAHACALHAPTLEKLMDAKNVVTDLSPLQFLKNNPTRMLSGTEFQSYNQMIEYVMQKVKDANLVMAGSDFNYQGWDRRSYGDGWKIMDRACESLHLPADKIEYRNARNFWKLG